GGVPWIPAAASWAGTTWKWGLAPAERVASWAILFLRDALDGVPDGDRRLDSFQKAQDLAGRLTRYTRKTKPVLLDAFRTLPEVAESLAKQEQELAKREEDRRDVRPTNWDLRSGATKAFESGPVVDRLTTIQSMFTELEQDVRELNETRPPGQPGLPTVGDLLAMEVVQNSDTVNSPSVPFPFEFLFMSAGVENSLLHGAREPKEKLAGIKLNHFAGFLKRSWRANDWLWGRMDGVEHVLRALFDLEYVVALDEDHHRRLADIAFPSEPADEAGVLADIWGEGSSPEQAHDAFVASLGKAASLVEAVRAAARALPPVVPDAAAAPGTARGTPAAPAP